MLCDGGFRIAGRNQVTKEVCSFTLQELGLRMEKRQKTFRNCKYQIEIFKSGKNMNGWMGILLPLEFKRSKITMTSKTCQGYLSTMSFWCSLPLPLNAVQLSTYHHLCHAVSIDD
jgi:hypothetical protein